jgi:hypothetical protein
MTNKTTPSESPLLNDILKAIENRDISIFSLLYLYKYNYISFRTADICYFAHLGEFSKIIELFNEKREDELLKMPGCHTTNIESLRKLVNDIVNPETNQKYFDVFEARLHNFKMRNRKEGNPDYKMYVDKNLKSSRLSAFRNKYDLTSIENYDLQQFFRDEKLSVRASNALFNVIGISSVAELLELYVQGSKNFLNYQNVGKKTLTEIEDACRNCILKLPLKINPS